MSLLIVLGVLVLGGLILAALAKLLILAWVLRTYLHASRQNRVVTSRRREP